MTTHHKLCWTTFQQRIHLPHSFSTGLQKHHLVDLDGDLDGSTIKVIECQLRNHSSYPMPKITKLAPQAVQIAPLHRQIQKTWQPDLLHAFRLHWIALLANKSTFNWPTQTCLLWEEHATFGPALLSQDSKINGAECSHWCQKGSITTIHWLLAPKRPFRLKESANCILLHRHKIVLCMKVRQPKMGIKFDPKPINEKNHLSEWYSRFSKTSNQLY